MVVADLLQQGFHHFLVLVQQLVHILAHLVVEQPDLLVVAVEFSILELPLGGQLVPDLLDVLDGCLGVLVGVGLLAGGAQQEVLLALVVQADELVGLLVSGAGFLSAGLVHGQV